MNLYYQYIYFFLNISHNEKNIYKGICDIVYILSKIYSTHKKTFSFFLHIQTDIKQILKIVFKVNFLYQQKITLTFNM